MTALNATNISNLLYFIYNIATCDENWIYYYELKTQRLSMQGVLPTEDLPAKLKRRGDIKYPEIHKRYFIYVYVDKKVIRDMQCYL